MPDKPARGTIRAMAHGPVQLTPDLYTYYKTIGYREPAELAALLQHFQAHPQLHQHTLPEVAQLLTFLVRLTNPRHILEIGTFIGYSALAMALVMGKESHLITCDIDTGLAQEAQVFWEHYGQASRITFTPGPAEETLFRLESCGYSPDFVYIDANKKGYDAYYESALRLCPPGALILLDNTLSAGQVIHPHPPAYTQAILALNEKIRHDARVDMILLPLGDGLTLVRRR